MYEYGTLTYQTILTRGKWKKKKNGGDEPNQGILYACMEISQKNPCTTIMY
jgi:hypothetical protein